MTNPMDLTGRTIVVTGASSGIGRATSVLLAELGARLMLVGRSEARLAETAALLAGPGDHRVYVGDLGERSDLSAWMKAMAKEVGELDGLVHSAGLHAVRPLRVLSADVQDRLFQVNVFAAAELAKAFRQKGVRRAGGGSIVLLASVAGLVGQAGVSTYSATKGAVVAMTKSLALELARESIRINCVAPGVVRTEMEAAMRETLGPEGYAAVEAMHPMGVGEARDVANAIAFLLGESARWITGTALVVDGGYTAH